MALVYAVQNGDWSSISTWNTGSLPTNDDDVYTDGKIVTIDIDLVGQYRPKTLYARSRGTGGTQGGRFEVTTTRQIGESGYPVDIYGLDLNGARYGCVQFTAASPNTLTVYGNVYGGQQDNAYGVNNTNTGTVYITGNVTGGRGNSTHGINNASTGSIYITGNVTGGSGDSTHGINNASTGSIYVTGNVTGQVGYGINSTSNGTLVVIGDCYADPVPAVYWIGSGAYCEIRGNQYGGTSGAATGSMAVVAYKQAIPQAAQYKIRCVEAGSQPGTYSGNVAWLYGALAGPYGHPAQSDVRYGTTYGPENELTGTCRVPPPQSVAYGVPVDNTTGTAALTPSDIAAAVWDELRSKHTTTGTYGAVSEWAGGGGSGEADWTEEERKQIRYRLGIDGEIATPNSNTPHLGTMYPDLDQLASHGDSSWTKTTPGEIWTHPDRTITDKTGFRLSEQGIDDIWNELQSGHTTAGTFGAYLNTQISSRAPADTALSNLIWTNDKASYLDAAISSRLEASSYVAPDNASISAIKTQTDKLLFDSDNRVYAIADVEGTGVQVVVQPLVASVQRTDGAGGVISGWTYARLVASWNVKDVDLSGHDLRLILYNRNDPASAIVEYSTGAGEITITYNNPDSLVEVDGPDSKTPNAGNYAYVLRDQTTDTVLLSGNCLIQAAPDAG